MKSLFVNGQLGRSFTQLDTVVGPGPERTHRFADFLSTLAMDWNDGTRHALVYQDYLGSRFRADAGFFDRVDARDQGDEATVTFRPENRWLRSVEPTANSSLVRSSAGALQDRTHSGAVRWSFQQQTFLETRLTHVDEVWLGTEYHRWRYLASASNTRWRPLSFG